MAGKIVVWFFQTNNMVGPVRQGNFVATTRIINGGPGASNQQT